MTIAFAFAQTIPALNVKYKGCSRLAPKASLQNVDEACKVSAGLKVHVLPRESSVDWPLSRQDEQANAPLLAAVKLESERVRVNLFCPGHKQGAAASPDLKSCIGHKALSHDLPELPALDNLFAPEGVIAEAQDLATCAFIGEDSIQNGWSTFFLVNGSTCGIEAAILASVRPGRRVILPRNAHQSALHALVLSGGCPIWLDPAYDDEHDLVHGVQAEQIASLLNSHIGTVDAVLVVSPTYHGVCTDISTIAKLTGQAGVPLIVDEAHGAHFAFHEDLPSSAVHCGADIVVQSTHKTLGSLTQSAMMHVLSSQRIDKARVRASLQLVQSTSPSYLLLSSLDSSRHYMTKHGKAMLGETMDIANEARRQISQIPGYSVLEAKCTNSSIFSIDQTRLTLLLSGCMSGYDLDSYLIEHNGIYAELPSFRHITFIFTAGNSLSDVHALVESLNAFSSISQSKSSVALSPQSKYTLPHTYRMSPREAFFADSEIVSAEAAIGRVSPDALCPYPPGIPVICPGEVITEEAVRLLQNVLEQGGSVTGAADDALHTLRVIKHE